LTVFDPDPLRLRSLSGIARDLVLVAVNEGCRARLLAEGDHRAEVHQATGMVSVQCGCQVGDALLLIRAYAFSHGETIGSVADRVLRHELRIGGA
jgi:hypothetical protein